MYQYLLIVFKLLRFNFRNSFFTSFINFFTILCTILSVAFILTTTSISTSFKEIVKNKIIKHDGYAYVYKHDYSLMNNQDYNKVFKKYNDDFNMSRLLKKEVIVRKDGYSEAGYLKAIEFNKNIYNLNISLLIDDHHEDRILIGSKLANKLNVIRGDSVNVIYQDKDIFKLRTVVVGGVFTTNIEDFDKYNILCDLSLFYEDVQNADFESIVLNVNHQNQNNDILINFDKDEYNYVKWDQKYKSFLFWLNQFDSPINILLFFIMLICVINILSSTYVDITYRMKDLFLLHAIGYSINKIVIIYTLKYTLLSFFGGGLGYLFVLLFQQLQNYYHIISIPENIYYMKYLPINIHAASSFQIILLLSFLTFILSFFIIKKNINKNFIN